jgi:hypothetical protein
MEVYFYLDGVLEGTLFLTDAAPNAFLLPNLLEVQRLHVEQV